MKKTQGIDVTQLNKQFCSVQFWVKVVEIKFSRILIRALGHL